jgi:hypothetical protein
MRHKRMRQREERDQMSNEADQTEMARAMGGSKQNSSRKAPILGGSRSEEGASETQLKRGASTVTAQAVRRFAASAAGAQVDAVVNGGRSAFADG